MKANQLRIGNRVMVTERNEPYIDIIIGIEEDRVSLKESAYAYDFIEEIEPIPLTEDWLMKFGLEKIAFQDYSFPSKDHNLLGFLICQVDYGWNIVHRDYLHTIQYVHELQNLYFALTGEDLTQID